MAASPMEPPSRLFDYVVIVALRPDRRDTASVPIVKPHLRYRFPTMPSRDGSGAVPGTETNGAPAPPATDAGGVEQTSDGRPFRPTQPRGGIGDILSQRPRAAASGRGGVAGPSGRPPAVPDARQLRQMQKSAEEERKLYKAAKKFCFPDLPPQLPLSTFMASFASSYGQQQGETFSFTLTESNGAKRWGYCLRAPGPAQAPFPQCICIISFLPCFSIFSTILQELTGLQKADAGFEAFTVFLNAVYREPLPPPGGTLRVALPRGLATAAPETPPSGQRGQSRPAPAKQITGDSVEYAFTRPDDSESLLDHVNFEPLLHFLDPSNIASILASLIVERRMIFIATNLNTLSSCVQAAASILYPFNWQHIFIPVVPQSLLSFCCAPMPFLVGVLRVHLGELKKLSDAMEEVVVVDVDNNKVLFPEEMDDVKLLPPSLLDPLMQSLLRISKEVRGVEASQFFILGSLMGKAKPKERKPLSKALVKDLQNVFIGFMVDMLATYKDFMRRTPIAKPASGAAASFAPDGNSFNSQYFDSEGFMESRPPDMRALLELVTQAQLFVTFIEERHKRFVNSGKFEKRLTRRTRFTMYDTGAITRDEVTKSLWEEEKRWEEEQRRLGEEEEKKRKKASTAGGSSGSSAGVSAGGGGAAGTGAATGSGGAGAGAGGGDGGGGGGMASIWTRLFSLPGGREGDEGPLISDPSNFRKIADDTTGMTAWNTAGARFSDPGTAFVDNKPTTTSAMSTTTTSAPAPAGSETRSGGTAEGKAVPGLTRGITVGAGGWVKKSSNPRGFVSALASQSSSVGTLSRSSTALTHPYTASSVQSSPSATAAQEANGEVESSAGEPADDREEGVSKVVHEGGLVKLAGQQFYLQLSDKWQFRWFILTEADLSYYRPKDKRKPCGVIPLKKVAHINFYITHAAMKRNNLIELKTKAVGPGEGTPRTYYMEASSKDEGLRWLNAFQQVHLDSQIVTSTPS